MAGRNRNDTERQRPVEFELFALPFPKVPYVPQLRDSKTQRFGERDLNTPGVSFDLHDNPSKDYRPLNAFS